MPHSWQNKSKPRGVSKKAKMHVVSVTIHKWQSTCGVQNLFVDTGVKTFLIQKEGCTSFAKSDLQKNKKKLNVVDYLGKKDSGDSGPRVQTTSTNHSSIFKDQNLKSKANNNKKKHTHFRNQRTINNKKERKKEMSVSVKTCQVCFNISCLITKEPLSYWTLTHWK